MQGVVVDEEGRPVAGATVRATTGGDDAGEATTDALGRFDLAVVPGPRTEVSAAHPAFGEQWTDAEWAGWRRVEPPPGEPITLVLRRGIVLRGRALAPDGAPLARHEIVVLPAQAGLGPATRTARTDADGRFELPPMVLDRFELLPGPVRSRHPLERGTSLRFDEADPRRWVREASEGRELELRARLRTVELLTLVIGGADRYVRVWTRTRTTGSRTTLRVRAGRIRVPVELGAHTEIWIAGAESPTHPEAPAWAGVISAPATVHVPLPEDGATR